MIKTNKQTKKLAGATGQPPTWKGTDCQQIC